MTLKGRSAMSVYRKEVHDICKDDRIVKVARNALADMDVLVCGTCQQIFHLIYEFHEHKKKNCSKPKERTSTFGIEVWAFTLWKSSPKTKNLFPDATNNAVMWRNWKQLAKNKQDTWIAAGGVFYQLALLQKSEAEFDSAEFEKAMENVDQFNIKPEALVRAVPLTSLKKDPKLIAGPTVALERVFLPADNISAQETFDFSNTRNTYGKRAQSSENTQTQSKKSRVEVESSPSNEAESEESQEYVVEAIVGKKYDKSTMTFLYEIKWEGFPSSQNTWEPEANLTHCKDMIADYEQKKGSNISASGKPIRSSKARAMDKVKCWVGSKDSIEEFHSDIEIKIEEKDPLDVDYAADYDDGMENSYNPSESEEDQPPSKKTPSTKTPQKQTTKTKEPVKSHAVSNAKTPVSNAKTPVSNAKTPVSNARTPVSNARTPVSTVNTPYNIASNMDPKTTTLLVANSLGMVRVNAKALPNVKSGIYNIDSNEQLQRIKPLIPKVPPQTKKGLVVITNDASLEKPGIRRKTPFPLSSKNARALSKTIAVNTPQQPSTTFVVPPNPGNTPFLLVAPPGSGIGGLLFTPESATPNHKNIEPTITVGAVPPTNKVNAPKNSSSMIVKAAFAKAMQDKEAKSNDKTVDKSAKDISNSTELSTSEISLSMEVTQHDSDGDETINFTLDEGSGEIKEKDTKQDGDQVVASTELKEGKEVDEIAKQQSNSQENENQKESEKKNKTEITNKLLNESTEGGSDCQTEKENTEKKQIESEPEKLDDSNSSSKQNAEKVIDSLIESAFSPGQMGDIDKALETAISGSANATSLKDDAKVDESSKLEPASAEKVTPPEEELTSSSEQDFSLMGPQLVSIPPGIDPTLIELPPNTQLMVADSGEYYLVPLQPEGKSVALALDPDTGDMEMITMEDNS